MTNEEAIKKINMMDEALNFQRYDADECSQALQMAIESIEKQIPKKHHHTRIDHIVDDVRISVCVRLALR